MYQFENIKITEGNAFSLLIPLRKRTYVAQRPIDEDIDILNLQSVVVKFGGVEYPCTLQEDGVLVDFPADLKCGTYDLVLTADYMDNAIRAAYFEAVTIVSYNYQSDAHNFVQGSPIVMQPAFVIYNLSDAELEQLKQQYREAIAAAQQAQEDAEEAKEDWERKAAELEDVAQEATSQSILTEVENIDIDTSDLAKELTAQAAKDAADAAKQAAQAISGYALQGSDTTATNTAIVGIIGYTIQEIDGV